MSDHADRIIAYGRDVDRHISTSFCAAKWRELNLYLHLGQGHSCYHPPPQKIRAEEIRANPAALHNTADKIRERSQMMRGEKPAGCSYCWDIETRGAEAVSDRRIKNFEHTAGNLDLAEDIFSEGLSDKASPDALEVSFSNKCNLKCVYCNPKSSSAWQQEIEKFGSYGTIENNFAPEDKILPDNNEYVEAFNRWFPDAVKKLKTLRLTGGEPLLHEQTWALLETLVSQPRPDLIISINSNLSLPRPVIQRLADQINRLHSSGACKKVRMHISMESVGRKAEIARFGLNFTLWRENVELLLKETDCEVSFMSTYNVFAVYGFEEFLHLVSDLRQRHCRTQRRIKMDVPHLVLPRMFHVGLLPQSEQDFLHAAVAFMKSNRADDDPSKFSSVEIALLERILDAWNSVGWSKTEKKSLLKDLRFFISESERRRNTNVISEYSRLIGSIEDALNE